MGKTSYKQKMNVLVVGLIIWLLISLHLTNGSMLYIIYNIIYIFLFDSGRKIICYFVVLITIWVIRSVKWAFKTLQSTPKAIIQVSILPIQASIPCTPTLWVSTPPERCRPGRDRYWNREGRERWVERRMPTQKADVGSLYLVEA